MNKHKQNTWTVNDLIAFEEEIKDLFINKHIYSPVHLSVGSEAPLIEIFKKIKNEDWVFSTHRSHYHALLKGVSPEWLKNEIIQNRSIHINNKKKKFFTSAIMGGILPIAIGVSMGIKMKKIQSHVWAFVGDMTAEMGIFSEMTKYACRNNLPITFIVEDNGLSVNTPTKECWGTNNKKPRIIRYKYIRKYPHQGCGVWVVF